MALIWNEQSKTATTILGNRDRCKATITIGGSDPSKFVPNINAHKWDNEAFLNINHKGTVVSNQNAIVADGSVSLTVKDITHKYYITQDGKLEYEFILAKKPPINTIDLELTFSDAIFFCYQDTLENDWKNGIHVGTDPGCTLDEYLQHHFRPENVVGSYAVYYSKRNNKYATGKICHIYRPHLTDSGGKEIYADLFIDPVAKIMRITVDNAWLQSAVYPVTIDPTIGYEVQGGSTSGSADRCYVMKNGTYSGEGAWDDQAESSGTVSSFHVYTNASFGAGETVTVGIYNNSSGEPGTLLGGTSHEYAGTGPGWKEIDVSDHSWAIVGGNLYYCAHVWDASSNATYDGSKTGANSWRKDTANPPPDPWPTASDTFMDGIIFSMHFEYEESSYTQTVKYPRIKIRGTKPSTLFNFSEIVKYARTKVRSMIPRSSLCYTQAVKYARTKIRSMIPRSSLRYTMAAKYPRVKIRSTKPSLLMKLSVAAKNAGVKIRSMISASSLRYSQQVKNARVKIRSFIPDITITSLEAILLSVINVGIKIGTTVSASSLRYSQRVKTAGVKVRSGISLSSLRFTQIIKTARVKIRSGIGLSSLRFTQAVKYARMKIRSGIPSIALRFTQAVKYARVKIRSIIPDISSAGAFLITVLFARTKIRSTIPTATIWMTVAAKIVRLKSRVTIPASSTFEAFLILIKYARIKIGTSISNPFFKYTLAAKNARLKIRSTIPASLRFISLLVKNAGIKLRAMPTRSILKLNVLIVAARARIRATIPALRFRFTVGTKIARLRVSVPKVTVSMGGLLWLGIKKFVTKAVSYLFSSGSDAARFDTKAEDYNFVAKND